MKILFYNHTSQVSGAERVLLLILSRLNRTHFSPVLMCPDGWLRPLAAEAQVPCETVGQLEARFTWRPDLLIRYLASFGRVILEVRTRVVQVAPDLIHANSIRGGLVMTAATIGLRIPVIWHLHDMLPHHPISTAVRLFAYLSTRTRLVAVSLAVADCFRGHVPQWVARRVPLRVLHNAVESSKYTLAGTTDRAIRDELGLRDNQPLIGSIGQLTPRKGQLELLHAFGKVLTQIPDAVLLVVGGALFNHDEDFPLILTRTARKLGIDHRVHFLGQRNDVASIMQALDLLVVNSRQDPFPLVVLEGLACGTPMIATAVDGIPEMITHADSGWLVQPRDIRGLARAIINLLRQPELRARFAENGRRQVRSRFSVEGYMKALEAFYASSPAFQGPRSGRQHKVSHPSRDARPGTPRWNGA